jgi:threonine synthase
MTTVGTVEAEQSLANAQRSMGDPNITYPLWPPVLGGCPRTSSDEIAYPVEIDYAYGKLDPESFLPRAPVPGLDRWAPLMPPLHAPGLGEGGTPLVPLADGVLLKDESRNPTWSHKDRLNRCTVSAALGIGAQGVVAASSGNHGASAAAYAARAGLCAVVLTATTVPPAVDAFLQAYGAVVLPVPYDARNSLFRRVAERYALHPVSNLAHTHTGHPFGPEGYKSVAYEIHADLGDVPAAVFLPTGYGELLFGVWKGFDELRRLGLTDRVPRLFACEPAAGGPLATALRTDRPAARVDLGATDAYAIACEVSGYRAAVAVRASGGRAVLVDDTRLHAARTELAHQGLWPELSAAAGLAGLRSCGEEFDGPVVCVSTSSGFKDKTLGTHPSRPVDPEDGWAQVERRLRAVGVEPA